MPPTFVSVSGFYGREEELGWLRGLWDQATGGGPNQPPGGPRMAVILAESGLGKSRLVQALYQQLTTNPQWDPPEFNYWPDAFGEQDTKKIKVNPELKGHEPAGPPRFLWLGLRWLDPIERNEKDNRCPLPEARHALQSHVDTAKAQMGSWKSFLSRSGWSIARKVGEELLDSALDELIPFKNLVMKGVETAREMARARQMSSLTAHDRVEKQVADAAEELQNQLREVLSGKAALPTVLWLDDAQWIDPMTLKCLRGLWYEARAKGWPLLIVLTHWEREWRELVRAGGDVSIARYKDLPGVETRVLQAADEAPLRGYLSVHLPGLADDQRRLLLEKAGGNFLSMVENVGFLLKTRGNFVDKNPAGPLSPAGEKTVARWESDRAKRVEQRFHDLEEEVRRLLGWSSRMGIRFLQEVVDELAKQQGEDLDAGNLLGSCIDPLAILAEVNPHLREFRDRAFHQVASRYFEDMDGGMEEDLNQVLRDHLGVWIDGAFDAGGEPANDSPLAGLEGPERRDLLGMAMALYPLEGDPATVDYQRGLRSCLLAILADSAENLWDRVRETAKELESVDWATLPAGCAGVGWLEVLTDLLSTAGSNQTAMAIAKQVVEWMREICRQDSGDDAKSRLFWSLLSLGTFESEFKHQKQARACFEETFQIARQLRDQSGGAESLRYVLVSLWELGNIEMQEGKEEAIKSNFVEYFLGDIKVAEGNLAAAKVFLEEGLQIARDLREQLGTPQSLKDVCVSLGILGYIKVAEGNLATSRALFEERLQIARDLHEQLGTPQSLENVSFSLKGIGDIEIAELNFAAARAFFEEHLQIRRELYRQRGTPKNLDYLICSLSDFASIANNNEGIPFAHEAMEKSRMLYEGFPQYPRQSLELMTLLYEVAIR